jgi:hypothetical protein
MKCRKYEMKGKYIFQPVFRGTHIGSLRDPVFDSVRPLFAALEYAHLFLPVDEQEFVAAANELFASTAHRCA